MKGDPRKYLAALWICNIFVGIVVLRVLLGFYQFDHAVPCNSPAEVSRSCIASTDVIVERLETRSVGDIGKKQYGLTVLNNESRQTLWFESSFEDITVGSIITLRSWNGCVVDAISRGQSQREFSWDSGFPRVLGIFWLIITLPILVMTVVIGRRTEIPMHFWVINAFQAILSLTTAIVLTGAGLEMNLLF